MIQDLLAIRDEVKKINNDHKKTGTFWTTSSIDKIILEKIDLIVAKQRLANRRKRKTLIADRIAVQDLLRENT
jgi:hypothetical protein